MGFCIDSSQPEVQALMFVGEELGFYAELMKHGGVQVPYMDHLFFGVVAQFIGVSVGNSSLNTSSSHPNRKPFDMMIPSITLSHWGASKCAPPNHESVFKHSALL